MAGPSEEELQQAFKAVDADGSNYLTKEEVKVALKKCGCPLSEDAIEELMKSTDTDNDGRVDYKGINHHTNEASISRLSLFDRILRCI